MNPRDILSKILPSSTVIPDDLDDFTLWRAVIEIVSEPPRRKKLPDVNTIDDVVKLIKNSNNIMVLTGAGVSIISMHHLSSSRKRLSLSISSSKRTFHYSYPFLL